MTEYVYTQITRMLYCLLLLFLHPYNVIETVEGDAISLLVIDDYKKNRFLVGRFSFYLATGQAFNRCCNSYYGQWSRKLNDHIKSCGTERFPNVTLFSVTLHTCSIIKRENGRNNENSEVVSGSRKGGREKTGCSFAAQDACVSRKW